jgi:hypothetical protein
VPEKDESQNCAFTIPSGSGSYYGGQSLLELIAALNSLIEDYNNFVQADLPRRKVCPGLVPTHASSHSSSTARADHSS